MRVHKKDKVQVISGKDKGKKGTVLVVFPLVSRVLVEKVNIVKKHKKAVKNDPGGIIKVEKPIHVSNVMVICPKCNKPTKVGYKVSRGVKSRLCKKCKKLFN